MWENAWKKESFRWLHHTGAPTEPGAPRDPAPPIDPWKGDGQEPGQKKKDKDSQT